jgi:hypothetical protein
MIDQVLRTKDWYYNAYGSYCQKHKNQSLLTFTSWKHKVIEIDTKIYNSTNLKEKNILYQELRILKGQNNG